MSAKFNTTTIDKAVTQKVPHEVISGATLNLTVTEILVLHALLGRTTGSLTDDLWRKLDDLYDALPLDVQAIRPQPMNSDSARFSVNTPAIALTDGHGNRLSKHEYPKLVQTRLEAHATRI